MTRWLDWAVRIVAAIILLQTLYFKFTGAPESVFIFSSLGAEPWGRLASGAMELHCLPPPARATHRMARRRHRARGHAGRDREPPARARYRGPGRRRTALRARAHGLRLLPRHAGHPPRRPASGGTATARLSRRTNHQDTKTSQRGRGSRSRWVVLPLIGTAKASGGARESRRSETPRRQDIARAGERSRGSLRLPLPAAPGGRSGRPRERLSRPPVLPARAARRARDGTPLG